MQSITGLTTHWWEKLQFRLPVIFLLAFILFLFLSFLLIETAARNYLEQQELHNINLSNRAIVEELRQKTTVANSLAHAIANTASVTPNDDAIYRKLFKHLFESAPDQHLIAGGGIWPEPYLFDSEVVRHSYFWGKDENRVLQFFDDYNDPNGNGYHHEAWYVPSTFQVEGEQMWSSSYIDPYSLEPMVTVTVPIFKQMRFFGVATVDMNLSGIDELMKSSWVKNRGGYTFVVDITGKLISKLSADNVKTQRNDDYPTLEQLTANDILFKPILDAINDYTNKSLITPKLAAFDHSLSAKIAANSYQIDTHFAELISAIIQKPKQSKLQTLELGATSFKVDQAPLIGENSLISIMEMPDTHWKVINVVPQSSVSRVVSNGIKDLFWPFLIIAASTIIIIYLSIHYLFIRRVTAITTQLESVSDDMSKTEIKTNDKGELGQIVNLINQRTDQLHEITDELTRSKLDIEFRAEIAQTLQQQTGFSKSLTQVLVAICHHPVFALQDRAALFLFDKDNQIAAPFCHYNCDADDIPQVFQKQKFNHVITHDNRYIIPLNYADETLGILVLYAAGKASLDNSLASTLYNIGQIIGLAISNNNDRQALVAEKANAELANKAKSQFLSSMSHELRTPLNAILGFSQLLSEEDDNALNQSQQESLHYIVDSGNHLLNLINSMLELSAIEAGKIELNIVNIELSSYINQLVAASKIIAENSHIELQILSDQKLYVHADHTKLKQVLLNLLSNAIKYNHEDGNVSIDWFVVDDDMVRIEIIDTGIGIDTQYTNQLFDAFNRLGQESSTIEGTGIGLVVTKNLVELMDGSIGFSSVKGQGSKFWIDLPLSNPDQNDLFTTEEEGNEQLSRSKTLEANILYVEDNAINSDLMSAFFKHRLSAIQLEIAQTGEEALKLLNSHHYDLILMDINLPLMTGNELTQLLKLDPKYKDIPVLAVTASAMVNDIKASSDLYDEYITKPIDFVKLYELITSYLSQQKAKQS